MTRRYIALTITMFLRGIGSLGKLLIFSNDKNLFINNNNVFKGDTT